MDLAIFHSPCIHLLQTRRTTSLLVRPPPAPAERFNNDQGPLPSSLAARWWRPLGDFSTVQSSDLLPNTLQTALARHEGLFQLGGGSKT